MPSGPRTSRAATTSSGAPATISTTRPSQSVLVPYSKRVPGSATSGAEKASSVPASTLAVPVARSQRSTSAFQNQ